MRRYHQNYFSSIFVFKDAKSCHVFLFIYANIIFYFFIFERLRHMQVSNKVVFFKGRCFFVVFVERN
jgi:hypothetical protein